MVWDDYELDIFYNLRYSINNDAGKMCDFSWYFLKSFNRSYELGSVTIFIVLDDWLLQLIKMKSNYLRDLSISLYSSPFAMLPPLPASPVLVAVAFSSFTMSSCRLRLLSNFIVIYQNYLPSYDNLLFIWLQHLIT